MNIVQLQDQLKNFSQDQLVREMQMPSGNLPQFMVLSEIMRRKRMEQDFMAQKAAGDQGTVAQEAVAAAGVPQGGIADMARALAPQTDMAENTGVQAMARGGRVKKMQQGGSVFTDPAVIAMANRQGMSVEEYLRSLGAEEAARVEAGAARRATRARMMAAEPIGESITMPTQSDLDRRFQEEKFAFGASRPMVAPAAIDMPVVPSVPGRVIGAPAAGLASIAPALPAAPAADMAPRTGAMLTPEQLAASAAAQPSVAPVDAGVLPPPPPPPPAAAVPAPFFRLPPAPDRSGLSGNAPRDLGDSSLARIPELLSTEIKIGPDGTITAVAPEKPAPGPAFETRGREQSPRTLEEAAAAQKVAEEETQAARAAEEAAKTTPATATATQSGGAGGGGGGIAGVGGMSSYEQELMDMLGRREKAAEQDKWLALAQVGLNMMSSTQPTLGGAIGEAGLKGVESMRAARDQYDKDRLELIGALEQARMARAAMSARGGGGGARGASSGGIGLSAGAGRLLTQVSADIERLDTILNDPMTATAVLTPEQELQRRGLEAQRDQLLAYRQQLLYGQPLAMPEDDPYGDVADE